MMLTPLYFTLSANIFLICKDILKVISGSRYFKVIQIKGVKIKKSINNNKSIFFVAFTAPSCKTPKCDSRGVNTFQINWN